MCITVDPGDATAIWLYADPSVMEMVEGTKLRGYERAVYGVTKWVAELSNITLNKQRVGSLTIDCVLALTALSNQTKSYPTNRIGAKSCSQFPPFHLRNVRARGFGLVFLLI